MLDKNNREIKTGDVVKVSGGYFKSDNGLYYVEHSPGDPSWCGSDYSLRRLNKNGALSTAKDNVRFWPIFTTTNSWEKRILAKEHNKQYAEIEIIDSFDKTEIIKHFEEEANKMEAERNRLLRIYGEDIECYKTTVRCKEFYLNVASRLVEE